MLQVEPHASSADLVKKITRWTYVGSVALAGGGIGWVSYRLSSYRHRDPMIDTKGHRFETAIILTCVRWYLACPLSYRNLAEMMEERGMEVDPSNIYRWVQKFTPLLEAAFRNGKKRPVGKR